MAFKKGDKKPASSGIKKGTEHKTTAQAKELIITAINNQSVEFNETMALIRQENPTEWAKIMVRLMDFVLPKKVDVTTDGEKLNIPISTWADNGKKES
jgi:hypothetical protein